MDRDEMRRREQVVVSRLFGLGEYQAQDYDDVASAYGVTAERIRQIEAKALRKLSLSGPDFPA